VPSVIFEDSLTDAGTTVMGGTRVFYVAWEVVTDGPRVRPGMEEDTDALLGVGYWSLGNDLTSLGLISGIGLGEAHWMNTRIGQWVVPPGLVGADFSIAIAQYIHWAISPGTEVHLYVFGDS
jgi:hypothetical protein